MTPPSTSARPVVRGDDRLLAEAVRALERARPAPAEDEAADDRARAAGGDFEQRIVTRARSVAAAPELVAALRHLRGLTVAVAVGVCLLALLAGAGTARAILDTSAHEPVNFFWALAGALGVQTALLALWIVLALLRPRALGAGSIGGLTMGLARWLAGRVHHGPEYAAATEARAAVLWRSGEGRWLLSALSHAGWTAFNAGCLALVIVLLITRHYTFTWQTTILDDEAYRTLTGVVAFVPRLAGFAAPTADQIAAAQWPPDPAAAEAAATNWSYLLVGCIVMYGLVPRVVLLIVCAARAAMMRSRWRLDTSRAGYVQLRPRLMPGSARLGVIDPADADAPGDLEGPPGGSIAASGPPAVLGLEIEAPASSWPPALNGTRLVDLGFIDDGDDRRRVVERLQAAREKPRRLLVVCSLTTTPDRGHRSFVGELRRLVGSGVSLVLTGGEALRRRDPAVIDARVQDWRRLAREADLEPDLVAEVDLDHLTDGTRGALARLAGAEAGPAGAPHRRVEQAFTLIADHAGRWRGAPDHAQQAELHRDIGGLYRSDHARWRDLLRAPKSLEGDLSETLRGSARRVIGLLPPRLRSSPRWLASGALAGALGCVAAATLVAPAAIASLPAWAGLGASIAGVLRLAAPAAPAGAAAPAAEAGGEAGADAVRAAALFAMLLELQGRGESEITRLLDAAIPEHDDLASADPAAVRRWLDDVRDRLDAALAGEARS